jgi:hypothetical protein
MKVTNSWKDINLFWNMSIFRKLQIRYVLWNTPQGFYRVKKFYNIGPLKWGSASKHQSSRWLLQSSVSVSGSAGSAGSARAAGSADVAGSANAAGSASGSAISCLALSKKVVF